MFHIQIPDVPRDKRIENAFIDLFGIINQSESVGNEYPIVWDFSNCLLFHPFFLAPLAIYKDGCGFDISCRNISNQLKSYLDVVHFIDPLYITCLADLDTIERYKDKSYIPICKFELKDLAVVDAMQTVIQDVIEKQCHASPKIKTPLSYFLSELICNITQHSNSNYGYIYSQYHHREKCIDICIADSGITVYSSYVKTNKYLEEIGDSELMALKLANEGYSTKNLPDAENRGYGISTTKRMLVDDLNGEFFMLSGGAFHSHISAENKYIQLPETFSWNGTIILMRIPIDVPSNFDYSKYIN
jgi:anti-sigma regulatory factor (Ser/Thr protein kinase)